MRLLLVLHKNPVDWSRALLALKSRGSLEDFAVYPFVARLLSGISIRDAEEEILRAAADLQATAVLWCHTSSLAVSAATLSRLRSLPSRPVFGYWEGDLFQWPYRPFPTAARHIARASDVVFIPGYSSFTDSLRRDGCRDVRYAPLPVDDADFGEAFRLRQAGTEFDVVMVGNRISSRVPFKTWPGARQRIELVRLFERRLGRRFAIFGQGWKGRCAAGPIDFLKQGQAYAAGHIVLGNNNLHAAYYFSDRLPIAMTCGALLVHNWEPGFDLLFGRTPPLRFFRDTEDAWLLAQQLLGTADSDIQPERERARELAVGHFTYAHVQRYMIDVLSELWESRLAGTAPHSIPNPWLGREQL